MNSFTQDFLQHTSKEKAITKQAGNFSLAIFGTFFPGAFRAYMSKLYDFDFGAFLFLGKEQYGMLFFDLDVYEKTTFYGWERYKTGKTKEKFIDHNLYLTIKDEIDDFYIHTLPQLNTKSHQELIDILIKTSDQLSRLLVSTVYCEAYQDTHIKKFYESLTHKNTTESDFLHFSTLPAFSSFATEFDTLLIENDPIKNWDKILWTFTDYYKSITQEELLEKVNQKIQEKGGKEKIQKEIQENIAAVEEQKIMIQNFKQKLSPEELILFEFTQEAMELRDRRKDPLQKVMTLQYNAAYTFLKNNNISTELTPFCVCYDFISKTCSKNTYEKELLQRKESFLLYADKEKYLFEYDQTKIENTKNELLKIIEGESTETVKEIKGNTGCKGKVSGKVKVIHSQNEFNLFEPGDVLVTSMTRPEFVPLMKIASAIITDEGGITCHAAIVSRELNIPCVIGTKFATSQLHSGDLVEVDADNGVVRILEKTNH